jgi:hypothetical protein
MQPGTEGACLLLPHRAFLPHLTPPCQLYWRVRSSLSFSAALRQVARRFMQREGLQAAAGPGGGTGASEFLAFHWRQGDYAELDATQDGFGEDGKITGAEVARKLLAAMEQRRGHGDATQGGAESAADADVETAAYSAALRAKRIFLLTDATPSEISAFSSYLTDKGFTVTVFRAPKAELEAGGVVGYRRSGHLDTAAATATAGDGGTEFVVRMAVDMIVASQAGAFVSTLSVSYFTRFILEERLLAGWHLSSAIRLNIRRSGPNWLWKHLGGPATVRQGEAAAAAAAAGL